MKIVKDAVGIVRHNWRAYVAINAVYYGLVVVAMIFVAWHPEIQKHLLQAVGKELHGDGPVAAAGAAYVNKNVWAAIGLTFLVNLLIGGFLTITVPSMVVPYSGFLMGIVRAILWGLLLSPVDPSLRGGMIPHSLTLLIEGQGYILALLAVYVSGNTFLRPRSVGLNTHGAGYVAGLHQTASLYVLVTLVLAAAAFYEALEVIYLVPLFR
jgi:hypothetical protein